MHIPTWELSKARQAAFDVMEAAIATGTETGEISRAVKAWAKAVCDDDGIEYTKDHHGSQGWTLGALLACLAMRNTREKLERELA